MMAGSEISLVFVGVAYCMSLPRVNAQLTWKQKTLEQVATTQSKDVSAQFSFQNTGGTAVDVNQVQGSCGCLTETLKQRHFEP